VKNHQELLLTGGVHSNMFRAAPFQVNVVVNDEQGRR